MTAAALGLLATLVAAASVVDLRERRLPNMLTLAIFLAGMAYAVAMGADPLWRLAAAVLGGGAFLAVAAACHALTGRDGLGGGDIKLMAALGAWVGLEGLAPHYQIRLLRAINAGHADKAREIMYVHMVEAEKYMLEMAAIRAPGEND